MEKILLMFFFSLLLFSCEKTLPDVPDDEIPAWLKTRISQDEQTIKDYPKYMASWGAWIRYKWQKEYYFEYHNILNSSSIASCFIWLKIKMRYFSHQKPDKCPKCGSPKVVKIIYGEPSYKTDLEEEAGKIILGGRTISGNDPLWGCIDCKAKIFKRKFRTFP